MLARPLTLRSTYRFLLKQNPFRIRYLILAIIATVIFSSFRRIETKPTYEVGKFSSSIPSRKDPTEFKTYKIQATFPAESADAKTDRLQRQSQVKDAFKHAWNGYHEHAWLHDEVTPITGGHKDTFVGWAATLVDGLDTLWIMGMKTEFETALEALQQIDFSKPNAERVPVFETTIRYLGGLLGAWDISNHQYPILLEKATQLGDFLYRAFDTETGIPVPYYWWETHSSQGKAQKNGKLAGENRVLVAQIGSLSLEFIRLSQVTGDPKYADAVQVITDHLEDGQKKTALPGMWPAQVDCAGSTLKFPSRQFTLGAFADSLFEYLPKTHLLLPQSSPYAQQYHDMYRYAFDTMSKNLFFRPNIPGDLDVLFPGTFWSDRSVKLDTEVQHLACFSGGMVGLGSRLVDSAEELETAIKLTNSCVWAYNNTPTGIMPEIFHATQCPSPTSCVFDEKSTNAGFRNVDDPSYQLRPEAIESVFIMYRLTADTEWQDKGWKMFSAIEKHTKTDIANAMLVNVMNSPPSQGDAMESFWLAETLKYFYLLFSEPQVVSLDDYVLNTEAHPLKRGDV